MPGNESKVREVSGTRSGSTEMLIRIFGKKDREPYGDIVHYDLNKPVPYQGAADLVLRIDAIGHSLALHASENVFRSIHRPGDESTNVLPEEYCRKELARARDISQEQTAVPDFPETVADSGSGPPPKVQDTIYLQLRGRQHTSIQGQIWGRMTKKRYISFRSALELLYLLRETE